MKAYNKSILKTLFNIIIALFIIAAVIVFILLAFFSKKYHEDKIVNIKEGLTGAEYDAICTEYCLNPDTAKIEYIYRQGDQFGVMLLLNDCEYKTVSELFNVEIENSEPIYSEPSNDHSYITRKGEEAEKIYLPFELQQQLHKHYFCHVSVLKIDAEYHMEIEKYHTNNAGIYPY